MEKVKLIALIEELKEVETIEELQALVRDLATDEDYHCYAVHPDTEMAVRAAGARLRSAAPTPAPVEVPPATAVPTVAVVKVTAVRASRKYRLLTTNVAWSTTPQVHAMMAILEAHVSVGDVVDEEDIVNMMVANETVLKTNQGGKRIWDYYKGNSDKGLAAHGNIERL